MGSGRERRQITGKSIGKENHDWDVIYEGR